MTIVAAEGRCRSPAIGSTPVTREVVRWSNNTASVTNSQTIYLLQPMMGSHFILDSLKRPRNCHLQKSCQELPSYHTQRTQVIYSRIRIGTAMVEYVNIQYILLPRIFFCDGIYLLGSISSVHHTRSLRTHSMPLGDDCPESRENTE